MSFCRDLDGIRLLTHNYLMVDYKQKGLSRKGDLQQLVAFSFEQFNCALKTFICITSMRKLAIIAHAIAAINCTPFTKPALTGIQDLRSGGEPARKPNRVGFHTIWSSTCSHMINSSLKDNHVIRTMLISYVAENGIYSNALPLVLDAVV